MESESFDVELVYDILKKIEQCIVYIETWSVGECISQMPISPTGMMKLSAINMQLQVIGETVKQLDKCTNKQLLPLYPQIPWKYVMGLRDIISHHYFEIDAEQIENTVVNELPSLKATIEQMIADL